MTPARVPSRAQREAVGTLPRNIAPFVGEPGVDNTDTIVNGIELNGDLSLSAPRQPEARVEAPATEPVAAEIEEFGSGWYRSLTGEPTAFADLSSFLPPSSTTTTAENLFEGLGASPSTDAGGAVADDEWAAVLVPTSQGEALGELSFSFSDFMEDHPDLFPHSFARPESAASPLSAESDDDDDEREPEGPAVTLAGPAVAPSDEIVGPTGASREAPGYVFSEWTADRPASEVSDTVSACHMCNAIFIDVS